MNPAALSFSTIYNGFKNNDYKAASISVSGTISANGSASFPVTIPLSRDESVTQIYFSTSRNSVASLFTTGTYLLPNVISYDNGSTPTFPGTAPYSVGFLVNFSTSQVTITAFIGNPYAETLSSIAATYDLSVFTFIAPFVD